MTLQEALQTIKDYQHIVGKKTTDNLVIENFFITPTNNKDSFTHVIQAVFADQPYLHLLNKNDDFEVRVIFKRSPIDSLYFHQKLEKVLKKLDSK